MRPFIQIEAELDGSAQTEQLVRLISQYPTDEAIIKILYKLPPGITDRVDLGVVQRACANAQYLVGVIPLRTTPAREHRAAVKVGMDFPTLLNAYFDTKPELKEKKDVLIRKAVELTAQENEV
jgi:hypothetical protein